MRSSISVEGLPVGSEASGLGDELTEASCGVCPVYQVNICQAAAAKQWSSGRPAPTPLAQGQRAAVVAERFNDVEAAGQRLEKVGPGGVRQFLLGFAACPAWHCV